MARISANVQNSKGSHIVQLQANGHTQSLSVPPRADGYGSSLNGGQFLFLALATCYCNDLYREAAKQGIQVHHVEVTVEGDFEGEGLPATHVVYRVKVAADASREAVAELIKHTDQVAEIQNTLRTITPVELLSFEVITEEA